MTEIASHRGGAISWPENSLLAFRNALALPAEQLELDVHLSADRAVVVIHDATLDRTTDASGPVRARSLAALRSVRLKGTGGEILPTLAEAAVLTREAGRVLRLEIKADGEGRPYPGIIPACLGVLDAANMRAGTVLMSFQVPDGGRGRGRGRLRPAGAAAGGEALARHGAGGRQRPVPGLPSGGARPADRRTRCGQCRHLARRRARGQRLGGQ